MWQYDAPGPITLTNVTVDDAYGAGVDLRAANASLNGVSIARVRADGRYPGYGLRSAGGRVVAEELLVATTDDYGAALLGSDAQFTDVTLRANHGGGIVAVGSRVELRNGTIGDTVPAGRRGWGGYGIYVGRSDASGVTYTPPTTTAGLTVEGTQIERATSAGVFAVEGVPVELSGVTIRQTTASTGGMGDGVFVGRDGHLKATALVTSGNARTGVLLDGATGTLSSSVLGETPGLVQQACGDAVPAVAMDDVSTPGGARVCDDGPVLPATMTPPAWTDDIRVLD
jgi:hypothetical protein